MKAKIKLEIKGKTIELELKEAKELAQVLADMTGVKTVEHIHHDDRWNRYPWWDNTHPWIPYWTCDTAYSTTSVGHTDLAMYNVSDDVAVGYIHAE